MVVLHRRFSGVGLISTIARSIEKTARNGRDAYSAGKTFTRVLSTPFSLFRSCLTWNFRAGKPACRIAGWGRCAAWRVGLAWGLLRAAEARAQIIATDLSPVAPTTGLQNVEIIGANVPLTKRLEFYTGGSHVSAPRSYAGVSQLTYTFNKYVSLMSAYVFIQNVDGPHENRLWLAVTPSLPLGRFTLDDRNLLEQRFQEAQGNSARYKNRPRLRYQLPSEGTGCTMSVYDEVNYDFNLARVVTNRVALGVSKPLGQHCISELYYLYQSNRGSSNVNYVVLLFTYQFAAVAKQP